MGTIVFKLEAESAQAVSAFLKLVDAQKKVGDEARNTDQQFNVLDVSARSVGASALRMTAGLLTIGTAVGVIRSVTQEMKELREEAAEATITLDGVQRKLMAIADIKNPAEREALAKAINEVAVRTATSPAQATSVASQLLGQGFRRENLPGILEPILKMNKLGQGEVDVQALVGYRRRSMARLG